MNINALNFLFFSLLFFSINLTAQVDRNNFCSHDEDLYNRVKTDPDFKREVDSVEAKQNIHFQNYLSKNISRTETIYYIPVVYHIVHEGGVENISDAQIKSDLKDLNDVFRKRNSNIGNVNPAFAGISADIEIEFRLAQRKNDGTCFSGITRTFSSATNGGGNNAVYAVQNEHGDFPGNKYMNIFITKSISSGAAGYTYRPGPPFYSGMDNGIHVLYNYVGNIGTSTQPGFNTTTAHEAGHWLNLPHLWGNSNDPGLASNCNLDDGIYDTPNTQGWTTCNTSGVTCGTLDNVENVMEYSYCSKMFTEGQKSKMRAAITSPIGGRNNLITSANQAATGIFADIMCEADFTSEKTSYCQGETVQYSDNSFHNPTSWLWNFPGGTPSSSTLQNPTVVYNNPGRHSVSLTVSNANGTKSITKVRFIRIVPSWGASLPYNEGFEGGENQFIENWQVDSMYTNPWKLSTNYSSNGSACVMIQNFNASPGETNELISRSLNLTGNSSVTINFDYSYARKPTSTGESVQFLMSSDCGETWVVARGLNPTGTATYSEFFPTIWISRSISVNSSFFTPNFRFKFVIKNGNGNNFYLDNININNVVGIEELDAINSVSIFPNPMNDYSTISLDLNQESTISIDLLNTLGQSVSTIANKKKLSSGNTTFKVTNNGLSSGIYFVKITVNGKSRMEKILIN